MPSVGKRLNLLLLVTFVPLTVMTIYLIVQINTFSRRYDASVENITIANNYNLTFKESIDYTLYIIITNSEHASELVDVTLPQRLIAEARTSFRQLSTETEDQESRSLLNRILRCLDSLETEVSAVEATATSPGYYDENMSRLELDIRVITELIQDQIQQYINHEAGNMEMIQSSIRRDVSHTVRLSITLFALILVLSLSIGNWISHSITDPVEKLVREVRSAGRSGSQPKAENPGTSAHGSAAGNEVQSTEEASETALYTYPTGDNDPVFYSSGDDEIEILDLTFHQMMERIEKLVGDIREEQENLRDMELRLLQEQINPHFLYNTLDAIIWLAESGQTQETVDMVSTLSSFFRTTLSGGRDFVSVAEERSHIDSYLKIQKFRYTDILRYEIRIPDEICHYRILKLTLQPLVENALYHGIKEKRRGGWIYVSGREEDGDLVFTVRDTGIGMTEEELAHSRALLSGKDKSEEKSGGFGLYNIQQRLRLNYGKEYGLTISSKYGEGTVVTARIPALDP